MPLEKVPISVIVTAHDRREFLMEALESLSHQSIGTDAFEVIVIKNFKDVEIDKYAEGKGFRLIFTEEVAVGAKIAEAVSVANGDVITILEDDDLFETDKLEIIARYFADDSNLNYVHNSFKVINDDGDQISDGPLQISPVRFERDEGFVHKCVLNGLRSTSFVYSSCVSMRREGLLQYLDDLKEMRSAPDMFYLFWFVNSKERGIWTPEKLSRYRLHESMSHKFGSSEEAVNQNINLREAQSRDFAIMKRTFQSKEANRLARFFYNFNVLWGASIKSKRAVSSKIRLIFSLIVNRGFFKFHSNRSWTMLILAVISVFSPHQARKFFLKYRTLSKSTSENSNESVQKK